MDERRRFQIALGGVASCVLIAAMFVSSAPPLEYPAVRAPQAFVRVVNAGPDRPTLLPQGWDEQEPSEALRSRRRRPARVVREDGAFAELVAPSLTTPPVAGVVAGGALPLSTREPRIVLTNAPATRGAHVAASLGDPGSAAHEAADHGPLTGAFATAGKEVGRGFRIAGRAIKAIF